MRIFILAFSILAFGQPALAQDSGGFNREKVVQQVKTAFFAGKYEQANRLIDELIENNVESPDIWTVKGQSLSSLKKYDEAVACLDKAIAADPKSTAAIDERMNIFFFKLNQPEKALEDCNRLFELGREPHFMRARIYHRLNIAQQAIKEYSEVIKNSEDKSERGMSLFYRGSVFENLKAWDLALVDYRRCDSVMQNSNRNESQIHCLIQLQRYKEAVDLCNDSFSRDPNLVWLTFRAEAHAFLGQTEKAKEDLQSVEKMMVENKSLANDEVARVKYAAAKSRIESIYKGEFPASDSAIDHEMREELKSALDSGDAREALRISTVLALSGDPYGMYISGKLFSSNDGFAAALKVFSRALNESDYKTPETTYLRANVLFDLGAYDLAKTEFEKAVELGHEGLGTRSTLGILHLGDGEFEKGIADYTYEITVDPPRANPGAWLQLSIAYSCLGDLDTAKTHCKTLIEKSEPGTQLRLIADNTLKDLANDQKLLNRLLAVNESAEDNILEHFNPQFRPVLDGKKLKQSISVVSSKVNFNKLNWMEKEAQSKEKPPISRAEFPLSDGSNFVVHTDQDGLLIGMATGNGDTEWNTWCSTKLPANVDKVAQSFWPSVFQKDFVAAHKLFTGDSPENFPFEKFEAAFVSMVDGMESPMETFKFHTARIMPFEPNPSIRVLHVLETESDKVAMARLSFVLYEGEFRCNGFEFGDRVDDRFFRNDPKLTASSLRDVLNGKSTQFLDQFRYWSSRKDRNLLAVYLQSVREHLGEFVAIDPDSFCESVSFEDGHCYTETTGQLKTSKTEIDFVLTFQDNVLTWFKFEGMEFDWVENVEDLERYKAMGEKFLATVANGSISETRAVGDLHEDDFSTTNLQEYQKRLARDLGKVSNVEFDRREFQKEKNLWVIHYRIQSEQGPCNAKVAFRFFPYRGEINSWSISSPSENAKKAANATSSSPVKTN